VKGREVIFLYHEKTVAPVTLVKTDDAADICILRSAKLKLAPIGRVRSFTELKVGERVYTIGTPIGLERSLSDGLVSGLRYGVPGKEKSKVVQTTAPIAPGSSGGGLFDARGNLIGITTSMHTEYRHISFSMATDHFWPLQNSR
jgi:S1-C subfamily serine protease